MSKKPKTKKPTSKKTSIKEAIKHHRLVIVLSVLLLLVLFFTVLYPKYKDWDNAQLIKGLARDFPILVSEIEQATGVDLEIKSNCATTTEKFSGGVKTCEFSVANVQAQEVINDAVSAVISSEIPSKVYMSETKRTHKISYNNKNACQIANQDSIYLTCITAVRDANTQLAVEEFSKALESR